MRVLSQETGIPIWNASLDQKPLAGFQHTLTAPETLIPARLLSVDWVPMVFLYLAPSRDSGAEQWIRIGNGLTDVATLKNRIINFVEAYRHAIIRGSMQASNTPSPDFSALTPYLLARDSMVISAGGKKIDMPQIMEKPV